MKRFAWAMPPYRSVHIIVLGSITLLAWVGFLVWAVSQSSSPTPVAHNTADDSIKVAAVLPDGDAEPDTYPTAPPIKVTELPENKGIELPDDPNHACMVLLTGMSAVVPSVIGKQENVAPFNNIKAPEQGESEVCSFTDGVSGGDSGDDVAAHQVAALLYTKTGAASQAENIFAQLKQNHQHTDVELSDSIAAFYDTDRHLLVARQNAEVYQFYAGSITDIGDAAKDTSINLAKMLLVTIPATKGQHL